jgi:hypothetical protein
MGPARAESSEGDQERITKPEVDLRLAGLDSPERTVGGLAKSPLSSANTEQRHPRCRPSNAQTNPGSRLPTTRLDCFLLPRVAYLASSAAGSATGGPPAVALPCQPSIIPRVADQSASHLFLLVDEQSAVETCAVADRSGTPLDTRNVLDLLPLTSSVSSWTWGPFAR